MSIKINITNEESSNNDFLIIFDTWGQRPNRIVIQDTFIGKDFEDIILKFTTEKFGNSTTLTELLPNESDYIHNERVLIQIDEKTFISFVKVNLNTQNYVVDDVCIYYRTQDQKSKIDDFIKELSQCIVDQDSSEVERINTLELISGNLELCPIFFEKSKYSLEQLYSHKSVKRVKKLIKSIKSLSKGLTIIHGDKGLGKTNLSKYIASKVDCFVIYIPNNLIESSINNPEFRNFLKKHSKSLLIIDDCEFLYNPIYGKNNNFTSNLIQLVDSVFSEQLELQILLLFNLQDEEEIDSSLIDSNNLIDILQVDELDSELASELSKDIGHNRKYKNNSRLVDVFKNNSEIKKNNIGL